jgi:hypothetical protein
VPSSCVALGQNHPLARLGESLRGRPRYGLSRRRVEEGNDGSRVRELHQDHRKKLKNAHTARGACSQDGCSNNGPPTNHIPRRASLDQGRISRPCPALTVEMRDASGFYVVTLGGLHHASAMAGTVNCSVCSAGRGNRTRATIERCRGGIPSEAVLRHWLWPAQREIWRQ